MGNVCSDDPGSLPGVPVISQAIVTRPLNHRVSGFAALPQPPPAIPLWGKVLWYLVESAAGSVIWQQFESGDVMYPTQSTEADPDAGVWTRWKFDWIDVATTDTADTQCFTVDVVNYTSGAIDSSWTTSDFNFVADQMVAFGTVVATHTSSNKRLDKISAYLMAFRPYSDPKPFAISGGPAYVRQYAQASAGLPLLPPQVRSTITEETPSRRHWGRLFLPTPGTAAFQTSGHLTNAYITAVVNGYSSMVQSLLSQECQVVVPTTMVDKQPTRTLQNVTGLHADTTADVIRSGRHHTTAFKYGTPAAATQPVDELDAAA